MPEAQPGLQLSAQRALSCKPLQGMRKHLSTWR